jgi:23S rRNA (guanosine2251-2'-O)-methyltransferase
MQLKNPHSVLAALATRPQDVLEVRVDLRSAGDVWKQVADAARAAGVPVRQPLGGDRPGRAETGRSGRGGAAEATVRERADVALAALFAGAKETHGLWVALDQLQDPHNVGAIFRTAAFYGVRGIVVTRDRSAPLSAAVYDVSSGGMEYVPCSVQTNLSRSLEAAKEAGLWVLGASERAGRDVSEIARDRSWLLVVGNEERGLRRLTLDTCDETCRLTPRGEITSLNVSVATGILVAALSRLE